MSPSGARMVASVGNTSTFIGNVQQLNLSRFQSGRVLVSCQQAVSIACPLHSQAAARTSFPVRLERIAVAMAILGRARRIRSRVVARHPLSNAPIRAKAKHQHQHQGRHHCRCQMRVLEFQLGYAKTQRQRQHQHHCRHREIPRVRVLKHLENKDSGNTFFVAVRVSICQLGGLIRPS